jgi:hypothetical protein
MANLAPPKKSSAKESNIEKVIVNAKPSAPTEQTPPDAIKPIQLKIPESSKNEFKAYAAMRGRSMNALFLDMFAEYKEKHS